MDLVILSYWTAVFEFFAAILSVPKVVAEVLGLFKRPAAPAFKK